MVNIKEWSSRGEHKDENPERGARREAIDVFWLLQRLLGVKRFGPGLTVALQHDFVHAQLRGF